MYFTFVDLRPYDKRGLPPIDSGHRKKASESPILRGTNVTRQLLDGQEDETRAAN